jgi:ABC-type multidrug transport system permease subunit
LRSTEAVNGFMFTVMFPLTFVTNTFAPPQNMPTWLRVIAEWNPVSARRWSAGRSRASADGGLPRPVGQRPGRRARRAVADASPVVASIGWSIVFTALFAPLALMAFRRRSQD